MSAFRLAILDLIRRPLSSLIAIISISLSVATAGTLLRLGNLAEKRFSSLANAGDAIVGAKSGDIDILLGALNSEFQPERPPGYLPLKLFESLRAQQTVKFEDGAEAHQTFLKSITPFVYAGTLEAQPAVGTDESILQDSMKLQEGAWATSPGDLVVGSTLARDHDYHLGQVVTVHPLPFTAIENAPPGVDIETMNQWGRAMPFKITGILQGTNSAWDRQAWMNLVSARVLLSHTRLSGSIWGSDVLNYFILHLNQSGFGDLKNLINDRTVGLAVSVPEAKEKLAKLTGAGRSLGVVIVALVLLMAVLSLASVLLTRFESLALQLAVLRAIGYSKRELATWLIAEGLVLGLCACVVGAACDAAAFPAIRRLIGSSLPPPELVSSSVIESYPIWIAALIATLLSVAMPIIRTYRQDVHTSLRA